MKDKQQLLSMLSSGTHCDVILRKLAISPQRLLMMLQELKETGYCFKRHYHADGSISFSRQRDLGSEQVRIHKFPNHGKVLVFSDTHGGSNKERLDFLDRIYDYAIDHDIHHLLHTGDFFHGVNDQQGAIHQSMDQQLKYVLKKYPYDEHILNFVVFGDHDFKALQKDGCHVQEAVEACRVDVVPLGYGQGEIHLNSDRLCLFHRIDGLKNYQLRRIGPGKLNLYGHHHGYASDFHHNILKVNVPTLSAMTFPHQKKSQGFIEMQLDFNRCNEIMGTNVKYLQVEPYVKIKQENYYKFQKRLT